MIELTLPAMTCGHCAAVVFKTIRQLDPNAQVTIDLPTKTIKVDADEDRESLAYSLTAAGYPPSLA
jgi:copper chaperone